MHCGTVGFGLAGGLWGGRWRLVGSRLYVANASAPFSRRCLLRGIGGDGEPKPSSSTSFGRRRSLTNPVCYPPRSVKLYRGVKKKLLFPRESEECKHSDTTFAIFCFVCLSDFSGDSTRFYRLVTVKNTHLISRPLICREKQMQHTHLFSL